MPNLELTDLHLTEMAHYNQQIVNSVVRLSLIARCPPVLAEIKKILETFEQMATERELVRAALGLPGLPVAIMVPQLFANCSQLAVADCSNLCLTEKAVTEPERRAIGSPLRCAQM